MAQAENSRKGLTRTITIRVVVALVLAATMLTHIREKTTTSPAQLSLIAAVVATSIIERAAIDTPMVVAMVAAREVVTLIAEEATNLGTMTDAGMTEVAMIEATTITRLKGMTK